MRCKESRSVNVDVEGAWCVVLTWQGGFAVICVVVLRGTQTLAPENVNGDENRAIVPL